MSSRVFESSSSPEPRRTVGESTMEAIDLLTTAVEMKLDGLADTPEFQRLALLIQSTYPLIFEEKMDCKQCGELFVNVDEHKKHAREVHASTTKGHICSICQKSFNSTQNLQAHKSREHSSLSDIKFCPFCNLEVLESIHLHNKTNHPYACFACKTDFQNSRERALHDGAIHSRKFICHSCWRTFLEKTHLNQHQIDSHTVTCRTCIPPKSFSSSQALEAHYNAKHLSRIY